MLTAPVVVYALLIPLIPLAEQQCAGIDDEGTMAAPASLRGRLLCTGPDSDTGLLLVYWLPAVLLLVLALVLWLRTRRVAWFAATLVLAAASPLLAALAVNIAPASCIVFQRQLHGAEGCERNRELRHFPQTTEAGGRGSLSETRSPQVMSVRNIDS